MTERDVELVLVCAANREGLRFGAAPLADVVDGGFRFAVLVLPVAGGFLGVVVDMIAMMHQYTVLKVSTTGSCYRNAPMEWYRSYKCLRVYGVGGAGEEDVV